MTEQARATTEHAWRDLPNNRPWSDWEPCDKSPHDGTKDWRHREVEQQAEQARATGKRWHADFECGELFEIGDDTSGRRCVTAQSMILPGTPDPHPLIEVVPAADLDAERERANAAVLANLRLIGARPAREVFDQMAKQVTCPEHGDWMNQTYACCGKCYERATQKLAQAEATISTLRDMVRDRNYSDICPWCHQRQKDFRMTDEDIDANRCKANAPGYCYARARAEQAEKGQAFWKDRGDSLERDLAQAEKERDEARDALAFFTTRGMIVAHNEKDALEQRLAEAYTKGLRDALLEVESADQTASDFPSYGTKAAGFSAAEKAIRARLDREKGR